MSQNFRDTLASVLGKRGGKKRKASGFYRSVKDGDLANPIQLDEFLEGVGGMLRLPPKEPVVAPKTTARAFRFALPRPLLWIGLAAGGIFTAAQFMGAAPSTASAELLPPQAIGVWTTADPRYGNRSFEITAGFLAFKNGDRRDDQTVHKITGVRSRLQGDTSMITLDYLEADDTYHLSIKYLPRPSPAIIFANQEELIWRKVIASPPVSQ